MGQRIENLRPCSIYMFEIFPWTADSEELSPDVRSFMTASPPPLPPQEMSVSFDPTTNKAHISWSEVECARGYRIHQTVGNPGIETAWDVDGVSVELESPEPCVTYIYRVSALVRRKESEPTSFQEMQIPPSGHIFDQPLLVEEERADGRVTLVMDNGNRRCKVFSFVCFFNFNFNF